MNIKVFKIWLILLVVAMSCAAILINLRQDIGVFLAKDLFDQLREETRYFASDFLWQKVDAYGHYGDWIKEKDDSRESSYSVFSQQNEVRSLWNLSVGINNENISRVCLVANSLGINSGLTKEAIDLLRGTILEHPDHIRKYRLYGELGVIYLQGQQEPIKALRYFEKSIEVLRKLDPKEYSFEDLFNIRLYSFSASIILFQAGLLERAYKYHRNAFFESGDDAYNAAMHKIMLEKGEQKIKDLQMARYQEMKIRNQLDSSSHALPVKPADLATKKPDHEEPQGKKLFKDTLDRLRAAESNRREMVNVFVHLIPQINPQLYIPINRKGTLTFSILGFLTLMFLFFRKKY